MQMWKIISEADCFIQLSFSTRVVTRDFSYFSYSSTKSMSTMVRKTATRNIKILMKYEGNIKKKPEGKNKWNPELFNRQYYLLF